jgi:hypothetical protein
LLPTKRQQRRLWRLITTLQALADRIAPKIQRLSLSGAEKAFLGSHFYTKSDLFAKTGSGQS